MGRVALHDVPGHQPVEEHPDRGQVLFDGRLRVRASELLDIRRDVHRRHPGQIPQAFLVAPGGESLDGFEVGAAGIGVADIDGEELPEASAAMGDALEKRWQTVRRNGSWLERSFIHAFASHQSAQFVRRTTRCPLMPFLPACRLDRHRRSQLPRVRRP